MLAFNRAQAERTRGLQAGRGVDAPTLVGDGGAHLRVLTLALKPCRDELTVLIHREVMVRCVVTDRGNEVPSLLVPLTVAVQHTKALHAGDVIAFGLEEDVKAFLADGDRDRVALGGQNLDIGVNDERSIP